MKEIKIGLVGSGYIGKTHAIAYAQAPIVFPLKAKLVCEILAEITPQLAEQRAKQLGFHRFTSNWHDIINDPNIDVVDICCPNHLHKEIAMAAIAKGKHVYCEKPLALNAADAKKMMLAAKKAGVQTLVGFNYLKNPTTQLAKEIIANGEIGDVLHFYGAHNEDYLADPNKPMDWHCYQRLAGLGTLGDLGAHIVSIAHYLIGDVDAVCGDLRTIITQRRENASSHRHVPVENEDIAHALVRFKNGAMGVLESSRIACGRKMGLTYVVTGTKGTLSFTQERMAELQLYRHDEPTARQGFKTILLGPEHPDYAFFCPSAGHGIGFNDQKTVEIRDLIDHLAINQTVWPHFEEGWKVCQVIEQIAQSYQQGTWLKTDFTTQVSPSMV